jgi:hypothetical protein
VLWIRSALPAWLRELRDGTRLAAQKASFRSLAEALHCSDRFDFPTVPSDRLVEKARFPDDSACSGVQQIGILGDEILANKYLSAISQASVGIVGFSTPATNQLFSNFFGSASLDDMLFVFGTYAAIQANAGDTNYLCRAATDPDCAGVGVIARTAKDSNTTRLCPPYFAQVDRSRASTLIHELSHQNRNSPSGVGTDDINVASIHSAASYGGYSPRCFENTCTPF